MQTAGLSTRTLAENDVKRDDQEPLKFCSTREEI